MTDKEFRKLSRAELIDIIYELQKQNESSQSEISSLRAQLEERNIAMSSAGSIAEAALKLNGVFEAAQNAADQYLESVKTSCADAEKLGADAKAESERIINDARKEADRIIAEAERTSGQKWSQFSEKVESLLAAHEELRDLLKKD